MNNILREIKWGFQRMFRGYSDDIFWAFDSYFDYFIPAIRKFCTDRLSDTDLMKWNSNMKEVYTKTLELLHQYEDSYGKTYEYPERMNEFWGYFGSHISYFWD